MQASVQRKARGALISVIYAVTRLVTAMGTENNPDIDAIDRRIIGILTSHGRLSFRDLGAQVHLSPNATAERVRRLQSAEIIRGFHAEVDHAKLGLSLQGYIDVRLRPGTSAQSFEAVANETAGRYQRGNSDWRIGF